MNKKLPVYLPTRVWSEILQRTTRGSFALCICLLVLFSGTSQAIDDEFPELVITGKQSNYSPTPPEPSQMKSATIPKSSQNWSANQLETPLVAFRNSSVTVQAPPSKVSEQSKPSRLGNNAYLSRSPIANKVERLQTTNNTANMDESLVSSIDTVRSPLRLRKHLVIRSSKNQFMRKCLVNGCFSRDGAQNFLVR